MVSAVISFTFRRKRIQFMYMHVYVHGSFDNVEQWKGNCGGHVVKAAELIVSVSGSERAAGAS